MPFLQGEVWQICFAEGFDRPGVVVTRNELNSARLVLVIPCTSGVRLTVYNLFSAARARLTLARISLADAVQMNGFGFWLCWLTYSVIAPIKSLTL